LPATLVLGSKFNTSTQPQYDNDKEVTHRFSPPSLMLRSQTMEQLQLEIRT